MAFAHVVVDGRVQGVGFRWFVREHARRVEVAGWVRNNPDGSVELCASGTDAALGELLDIVARGPTGAAVREVRHLNVDARAELPVPFAIMR
jgi:acylphosphatase